MVSVFGFSFDVFKVFNERDLGRVEDQVALENLESDGSAVLEDLEFASLHRVLKA